MRCRTFVLLLVLSVATSLSAWADNPHCEQVGGVLMTNINAIPLPSAINGTNLGPVFGDLAGSVAATILGPDPSNRGFMVQHYWVTSSGETITFAPADLTPTAAGSAVAVLWGAYRSVITGGTGKFKDATGYLDYFGLADFSTANLTLVLRYRGQVCYK
jgi:hypothetical protein